MGRRTICSIFLRATSRLRRLDVGDERLYIRRQSVVRVRAVRLSIVGDTVTLSSEVLKRDSTSVDEETVRGKADTLTLRNT